MCKGSGAPGNKTRSSGNSGSKLTRSFYLDFSREQTAAGYHERGTYAGNEQSDCNAEARRRGGESGSLGHRGQGTLSRLRTDIPPYFPPRLRVSAFTEVRFASLGEGGRHST